MTLQQPTTDEQGLVLSVLTDADRQLLASNIKALVELAWGARPARTEKQLQFLMTAYGSRQAVTEYEKAFSRFLIDLRRLRLQLRSQTGADAAKTQDIPRYEEGSPRPGWRNLSKHQ